MSSETKHRRAREIEQEAIFVLAENEGKMLLSEFKKLLENKVGLLNPTYQVTNLSQKGLIEIQGEKEESSIVRIPLETVQEEPI